MKRGMFILLFILLFACCVNAMTIDLISPVHETVFIDTDSVEFTCSGTITPDPGEELDSLTLYYKNNESTGWSAIETDSDIGSGEDKIFSISGLENATYTWNCLAVSNNSEETWADSNFTVGITFTTAAPPAGNTAPTWQQSTNQSITEDGNTTLVINLDYDSSDTEDDDISQNMTYSRSQSASSIIDCSISDAEMSCGPPATNQSGDNIVTVTATDSGGLTANIDYNISVMPVNDAPYLSKIIPNQTWSQDTNKTIDLNDYFSDADDDSLRYEYDFDSSSPDINVTIKSDGDAVFTPESGWTGTEKITFTAYDAANATGTSNEVVLTVQASNATTNNPPVIDTYLPETDPTISLGKSQTFKITKSDADGDSMNVTWYVDGVTQEGKTSDSFTYTPIKLGSYVVKVAVSDGQTSDLKKWTLTVQEAGATTGTTTAPSDVEAEESTSICGDKTCDEDETETSCCVDCGCPDGYKCDTSDKKCRKAIKSKNIILIAIIIILFLGGAAGGIYYYKKTQEKEIFGLTDMPIQTPPKGDKKGVKEEEKKPPVTVTTAKKPLKKVKTTNQVLLKKYIIYNLRKGKTFEQIKKELIKVGWKEDQIQDAYTAAQLDESFS